MGLPPTKAFARHSFGITLRDGSADESNIARSTRTEEKPHQKQKARCRD